MSDRSLDIWRSSRLCIILFVIQAVTDQDDRKADSLSMASRGLRLIRGGCIKLKDGVK